MKKILVLSAILILSNNLHAQQTIQKTLSIRSNTVNSTEILLYKQDDVNYYDIYSNNSGIGIWNSNTNVSAFYINSNDFVGIGTINPTERLSVKGKIRAQEIKVEAANWPDYVFDDDYKKRSLEELEKYVSLNKHLPEMPSALEVKTNGIELGDINKKLLKQQEELVLHLIEKDKEIKTLQKDNAAIRSKLEEVLILLNRNKKKMLKTQIK